MTRLFKACAPAFLILLPLMTGCGSRVTAPGGDLTAQTADDLAIQTATSLTVVGGDVQIALSATPQTSQAGARQARPARAAWDTTFSWNGITYEASRTYYDALDNAMPDYGPLAWWMRWTSRAYGTYEGPRDTAGVGHDALLDFHGIYIGQDTVRADGMCRDTLDNRFRSLDGLRVRYFYWVSSTTVEAVRILKSTLPAGGWPISGTVTYAVSADRLRSNSRTDVEAHLDATVVVTFNGTPEPEIVVNGTYRYRWNMQTGTVTRA
jgi:hypothetical protein